MQYKHVWLPFSYLPVLAGQTLAGMIARLSQFDDSIE